MNDSQSKQYPPATFLGIVEMFLAQAYLALGGMRDPETNEPIVDLALAKHSIDLLGVLEEKTKGNLTAPEKNYLENTLYQLRMNFVRTQTQSPKTEAAPSTEQPANETPQ